MKPLRTLGLPAVALAAVFLPACSGDNAEKPKPEGVYGKYTLFASKYDNVDMNKAKDNVADVLTQLGDEPNVCLIGLWAYNPPAILGAVRQARKQGAIKIVGFDEMEETLEGIKDGDIYATVVQQPFEFGYQSVKMMTALAKGDRSGVPANGLKYVPHLVIKKDNVEAFHKKLRELKKAAPDQPAPAADAQRIKVGFVSNNEAEFWSIAEAGTRKAANEFNVEVLFRRPKPPSAASQKEIIDDLLTQGVKAIAVSVIDPVNQKDYLNEIAAKVPLITQDNDAPDTKRTCYIGTDNIAAGREVGRLVKEVLPQGGTIAIFVGQPDPINARQRRQGVLDELAGKPASEK